MRKRILLLMLALVMLAISVSQAEEPDALTRQEAIHLEGVEETITTTYFESTRDYSIWIDTELLTLQPEDEGIGMDIFVKPNVDDRRYEVCVYFGGWLDYTFEQAVDAVQENMLLNYGFAEAFDVEGTFTDLSACGLYATVDDITILEYIVDMGNGAYYIHIQFPNEAAEGFGSRVIQMLASFEVFPCE